MAGGIPEIRELKTTEIEIKVPNALEGMKFSEIEIGDRKSVV